MLRQHYETDSLDASTLLAAIFGFLPGTDERMHATVMAIAENLTENDFVLRYRTDETDDGLSGKEGTFLICSFWLVSALAVVGEMGKAKDMLERLLKVASPLGPVRRGVRRDLGTASRELPASLLPPGAHRGRRDGSSWPSGSRRCRCDRAAVARGRRLPGSVFAGMRRGGASSVAPYTTG